MIDPNGIEQLYQALRKRGLDDATAEKYCALIGDTPEVNADGKWIVRDADGKILDKIKSIEPRHDKN